MDTQKKAREFIERIKEKQVNPSEGCPKLFCPRCGYRPLNHNPVIENSLSQYADVYICSHCVENEILRDYFHNPLPLTEWHAIRVTCGKEEEKEIFS